MPMWVGATAATATLTAVGLLVRHRARRRRLYGELARSRARMLEAQPSLLQEPLDLTGPAGVFAGAGIATVPGALTHEGLALLREEVLAARPWLQRSYIPLHKQGGTLSYERVQRHAPKCLGVFHSPAFRKAISVIVGAVVSTTAEHDQSACSVLYYTEVDDQIGWHYDHNFYRGRHFTVLLALVNESLAGELSGSSLVYRDREGAERTLATPPNTLVVFEGARIRHKVTPLGPGELRVILSMTYSTDPRVAPGRELLRRVKDIGFFGVRALWD